MKWGIARGGTIIALAIALFCSSPAGAQDDNIWHPDQDFPVETKDLKGKEPGLCIYRFDLVLTKSGKVENKYICEQRGHNLSVVSYQDGEYFDVYGVRIGRDSTYRRLSDMDARSTVILVPIIDSLLVKFTGSGNATTPKLSIFSLDDRGIVASKLNDTGLAVTEYKLNFSQRKGVLGLQKPDGSKEYRQVNDFVVSENRTKLLAWLDYRTMVVANVVTGEQRAVATVQGRGGAGYSYPGAVSDDGRYVFIGRASEVYDTKGCAVAYNYAFLTAGSNIAKGDACQATNIRANIEEIVNPLTHKLSYNFIENATALEFVYPRYNPAHRAILKSEGYTGTTLEYLALGDSYSSGEGDVADNDANYLADVYGSKNCHLGINSYPFLLRDHYEIAPKAMRSVACSGATVLPDYIGHVSTYSGQHDQTLGLSDTDREAIQKEALSTFSPGIVPQIEFVKKYKPSTITLTGGGNDVGFAEILDYCASPSWQELATPTSDSCQYVVSGSLLHTMLYESIDTQARYTARLLQMIKEVSPETNVILVGYPQFISNSGACAFNSGFIDASERTMIVEAVAYMNRMLKNEAAKAGVVYADIESSLYGGRMCEGSEYVTGLHDISLKKIWKNLLGESFHPNAKGHARIASDIIESEAYNQHGLEPSLGTETLVSSRISIKAEVVDGELKISTGSTADIETSTQTFADGTTVTTAMFSDEINLGEHIVSDDGALRATIDTSQIPLGRHVLVLRGVSPSGDELTLYQFVTAIAPGNDADADGIPDDVDRCLFIAKWYDERTGNDVCALRQSVEFEPEAKEGSPTPSEQKVSLGQVYDRAPDGQAVPQVLATDKVSNTAITMGGQPTLQKTEVLGNSINDTGTSDTTQNNESVTTWLWLVGGLSIVGALSYAKVRKKH